MITRSEQLFEEYCLSRDYRCERFPISHGGRFPDYLIRTPTGEVICEVKQIDPNEDDIAFDTDLVNHGQASSQRILGKRVRAAIANAAGQLKRFKGEARPCIAVLFDNTYAHYLTSADIDQLCSGNPQLCLGSMRMDPMLAPWLRMAATGS